MTVALTSRMKRLGVLTPVLVASQLGFGSPLINADHGSHVAAFY